MREVFAFFSFVSVLSLSAQDSRIINSRNNNPNEISIAVDHCNEKNTVAGSNNSNVYVSGDSGITWSEFSQTSSLGVHGDPVMHCDDSSIFFHAHLSKTPGKEWPEQFDRMVVQRSTDGGNTWSDGVGIGFNEGRMQDKPWLNSDAGPTSPFKGSLYISWTEFDRYNSADTNDRSRIMFARSLDRGLSFLAPVVVSDGTGDCLDGDGTLEGATTASGPNGIIYMVWAGQGHLWLDRSKDGGLSWGHDQIIADLKEGWKLEVAGILRCNGMPFIACDPMSGIIYITYADRIGKAIAVVSLTSADGGITWKKQLHGDSKLGDCFFPNIAVNPRNGEAAIVYYQCIGKNELRTDLTRIKEGAVISTMPISNTFKRPGKEVFFGDYIDIDYFKEGFIAAWTSFEKEKLVVRVKSLE